MSSRDNTPNIIGSLNGGRTLAHNILIQTTNKYNMDIKEQQRSTRGRAGQANACIVNLA